ncbi:MAG: hypothetical protein A2286_02330 [Gammaproteobacteria bacterium RIFOXYA12_FULL_61_12]|nr:MAG: hypothetical protein A2514_07520 [Gammaproteobacteria bacterium RIFOXYD12_FULL_61_37]OGT92670.1 MAG: hypothetical protein A2286_02330 [Gammaproteobacteria bacterium RIFOXYA12_FULL_61_12]
MEVVVAIEWIACRAAIVPDVILTYPDQSAFPYVKHQQSKQESADGEVNAFYRNGEVHRIAYRIG